MPASTMDSAVSIQNAVFVFAQLRSIDRKNTLPKIRKLIKGEPGRKFTPKIVHSEDLERAMKKDMKHVSKLVNARVETLREVFNKAMETMSIEVIQEFMELFCESASGTYFEFKVFTIMVHGFYSTHREMQQRFAAMKLINAAQQIFEMGFHLWNSFQERRRDERFQLMIHRFERQVMNFATMLTQHAEGVCPTAEPWFTIAPSASWTFYEAFKSLEITVLGESMATKNDRVQIETTSKTTGRIHARRGSPSGLSPSPRRIMHKQLPDSFDEYLNGRN